jgi:DNA-binding CsgD family transcriptional regulator/tetratricopeptide (TPR) repeat protein
VLTSRPVFVVGRDVERVRLQGLIDGARGGRGTSTVIRGEAGVGKSTLLLLARTLAQDFHVLSAAGSQSESELAFAGLATLLGPLLRAVGELSPVQAKAVSVALGLVPAEPVERLACYTGVLNLIGAGARDRPVLLLVDDFQWFDADSREAVLFVARRLDAEQVMMMLAVRDGEATGTDTADLSEIQLRGLEEGHAYTLLERAAPGLEPRVARKLWSDTAGNPLAMLEIRRLLSGDQLLGRSELDDRLPIGRRLEKVYAGQVAALPSACRRALLIAAASHTGAMNTIITASRDLRLRAGALKPAEEAGLVMISGGELTWRHPLLRSAVYHGATAPDRRVAHRALAHLGGDELLDDHQLWHLAAASETQDESVANGLEQLADRAAQRGAIATGARALVQAGRLTPDHAERARREVKAAEAAVAIGRWEQAMTLLEDARARTDAVLVLAQAERVQARAEILRGEPHSAYARLVAVAERVVESDVALAAAMLAEAVVAHMAAGDHEAYQATAARAYDLARQAGGEVEVIAGLLLGAGLIADLKTEAGLILFDRYRAHTNNPAMWRSAPEIGGMFAFAQLWVERFEAAEHLMRGMTDAARSSGAVRALAYPLALRAQLELRVGHWPAALGFAQESVELSRALLGGAMLAYTLAVLAQAEAMLGRADDAQTHAAESLQLSETLGLGGVSPYALHALALLALSVGQNEAAARHLEQSNADLAGWAKEPNILQSSPVLIEAHIRSGQRVQADAVLAALERNTMSAEQTWCQAVCLRCRGLLAAEDSFDEQFRAALQWHEKAPLPFERARTQLCYGERLRRARRRVDARAQLTSAARTFQILGATIWSDRAMAELAAAGSPRPAQLQRSPWTELTAQETRVARAIVDGATYQEAADALFLSPRTVEAHLRHTYRKLGVRSRTELTRRLSPWLSADLIADD